MLSCCISNPWSWTESFCRQWYPFTGLRNGPTYVALALWLNGPPCKCSGVEEWISLYLLGVNLQCLDVVSGIAWTMLKNIPKYHNGCRGHFLSHILQHAVERRAREHSDGEAFSPKKSRSSFSTSLDQKKILCIYCETFKKDSDEPIHRARSQDCSENLCKWAVEFKNWWYMHAWTVQVMQRLEMCIITYRVTESWRTRPMQLWTNHQMQRQVMPGSNTTPWYLLNL